MALVAINTRKQHKEPEAFFHNGLRPFFLAATIFSILAMSVWTAVYSFHHVPLNSPISILQWHSHEMIYGFCLAVISGFLLAALPEWTNVKTVHGYKLMGLLVLWAIPRVLLLSGTKLLLLSSVLDLTFSACLVIAIHAFTVGGIGLATVSTMARAALGHYGAYVLAAQFAWITSYALLLWVLVRVFRP